MSSKTYHLGKRRCNSIAFESMSSITAPTKTGYKATLDGIVTVSPMSQESKRKCFDGHITDSEASLRFVGFTKEQAQISKIAADDAMRHLLIARYANLGQEILWTSSTALQQLARPVRNSILQLNCTDTVKELHLDELKHQPSLQEVKISAEVIKI